MKLEFRNYRDYKGEKCFQILPEINYWYKHLDPDYTNALYIGWLWWGICIHFDKQQKQFSRIFTISNECRPMLLLNNGESQVKTDQLTLV